jgi:Flp pilus assembly protein TadG
MRNESGATLVEFALTFSVLMTFVMTLMEICLAFYTYGMISECAREGTRYAISRGATCVNGSGASCTATAASINSYVTGLALPNIGGGTMVVSTTFIPDNQPGSYVKVDVKYTFPIKLPFVRGNSLALENYSQMIFLQ